MLTSKTAGSRSETQADQIISRALKFLNSVSNDDLSYEEVTENTVIDFYLGYGCNISEFIENLETSMEMGHSGQLGNINALNRLIIENIRELLPKSCKTFLLSKC